MPLQCTTKASQAAADELEKFAHAQAQTLSQTPPKISQQSQHTSMLSKPQVGAPATRKSQGHSQSIPAVLLNDSGGKPVGEGVEDTLKWPKSPSRQNALG